MEASTAPTAKTRQTATKNAQNHTSHATTSSAFSGTCDATGRKNVPMVPTNPIAVSIMPVMDCQTGLEILPEQILTPRVFL